MILRRLCHGEKRMFKWRAFNLLFVTKFVLMLFIALTVSAAQTLPLKVPIYITFQADEVGKFPSGWISRDGNNASKIYVVKGEGEKKFLHADARGVAVQIGTEHSWALKDLPVLQWQWRAILFPEGTNEHEKNRNDCVLGIYVIFGHLPFISAIKYIWSDTLPVGTTFNSPLSNGTKVMVIRSGRTLTGTWLTEKRDVLSDYKQLFGEKEKNPVATGIGILTDSDNTITHAIGDYGYIEILGSNGDLPKP
jgi:hypothetical protein